MYKHSKVPKGLEVQYLKCTKIPHEAGSPSRKVSIKGLRKGALTWVEARMYNSEEIKEIVPIEENKFHFNFDSSCFRPVDKDGKTMKPVGFTAPSKYRFKTKEELIGEDRWDYRLKCPKRWTPEMNFWIGKEIPSRHNRNMERGNMSGISPDYVFPDTSTVKNNTAPDTSLDTSKWELRYDTLSKYRLKTRDELINQGLWHSDLGLPKGWGEDDSANIYLGKCLPSSLESICDKGESFKLGDLTIGSDNYKLTEEDHITKGYLEKISILDLDEAKTVKPIEVSKELESMEIMQDVLEKVYDNKELRTSIVPLFIGDPGLGKTKIIEKFANKKGAKLVELITSQMSPFEISGIAMPDKDTKKMTYYNFDKIETLKDGDILFFDELLNGNPIVLNACLTILEQRRLISGKELPDIMIIAAANPQGMVPLTPQIKERFLWYNVKFSPNMWKAYMLKKYDMPEQVSSKLCELIVEEEFTNNNFYTPRSIDKAVSMIIKNCPTPYSTVLTPILSTLISNNTSEKMCVGKTEFINPGESMMWLDFLKKVKYESIKVKEENTYP